MCNVKHEVADFYLCKSRLKDKFSTPKTAEFVLKIDQFFCYPFVTQNL